MANGNIVQIKHKCIIVGIKKDMIKKRGIYLGAAWAWKVNIARAQKAEYVLIVEIGKSYTGKIIGVIKDLEWHYAPKPPKSKNGHVTKRAYYIGTIERKGIYNGKTIPRKFRPIRNPVRYTF